MSDAKDYEWDAHMDMIYDRAIADERPVPKPSWTFPSPFVPYAVAQWLAHEKVSWGPEPRTLAELRMYTLSWAIRSKPEWQRKVADPSIMEKWRTEALDQQEGLRDEDKLTPNMVNYVLTELAGYARLADSKSGIECGPFDAIWFSDRLIPNELSELLRAEVARFENVLDDMKDWHPGSNGQVLDLVHPSLYCIKYGRTRDLHSNLLEPPPFDDNLAHAQVSAMSSRFSWLPSDFSVDATNSSVKLVSPYINNLHPTKHKALYHVIESIVSAFVPLFERVLSQINGKDKDLYRDITPGSGRIVVRRMFGMWAGYNAKFYGLSVPCIWSMGKPKQKKGVSRSAHKTMLRHEAPKVLPEAYEEYTGDLERSIDPYSLSGKTIQCIIKLANIHLTVENPEYKGGSWHVEGMLNERIVASGIYYYEEENISESRLAFRVTTGAPVYHQQGDYMCSDVIYGLEPDSHCCQNLGSIATSNGRTLAWPNIYQHRVAPFRLLDPTKPGHRKILAIFLVDPSINPIPSATTVPPQQAEWAADALEEARGDSMSVYSQLPPELGNLIRDRLPEMFVSREEAEADRLNLMAERTGSAEVHDEVLSHSFNMCEH
ncbi:hypothetical protein C8F04DRAFT_1247547 [Mycena alexandri]|uniref:Uncharacterized protein n=1 Tax=Mycena alexandri TaxID=1745969 RepID=A0AAD6XFB6_9AGAR|nr:hypothetical protein C8F04DRAFT_1247547 [Mycena alexandri]